MELQPPLLLYVCHCHCIVCSHQQIVVSWLWQEIQESSMDILQFQKTGELYLCTVYLWFHVALVFQCILLQFQNPPQSNPRHKMQALHQEWIQMSHDIMCTVINIKLERELVLSNTSLETPWTGACSSLC